MDTVQPGSGGVFTEKQYIMDPLLFEKEYSIHVYETGPNGRLTLYSLFDYLQDIASDHAVKLGFGRDDLMKSNHFWVLSRIYVEIKTLPLWEDRIVVNTWPNGTDKLFALRNYEVRHPDGRHIASGTSSWLILDQTTKKVQRPDSLLSHFSHEFDQNASPLRYAVKLEAANENAVISTAFKVRVSDLDINLHTNNVMYLKWVCDTYSLGFIMNNYPQSAEINYLAESKFNEDIIIKTSSDDNQCFVHSIIRTHDEKELCRIRIVWQKGIPS
jgi:medium-chain acyl-[acyl-carrier-protein] hydrolase